MPTIYRYTTSGIGGRIKRDIGEETEINQRIGYSKWKLKKEKVAQYFDAAHKYQLYRGDQPFGAVQEMTGREAFMKNRKYEDKFYKEIGVVNGARLWKLKLIKD